jgi:hypothetical protein
MQFLGQIHHLEIQAEAADHVDGVVDVERVEDAIELRFVERRRIVTARAREGAQTLDEFVRARARVLAKNVADEPAEVRDARAERRRGITVDGGRF